MEIRTATECDYDAVLALNEASVEALAPLPPARLLELAQQSCYFAVAEVEQNVVAFWLVFDQNSQYDSPNYRWFRERYAEFWYIDRIVVHEGYRGQGIGKQIYQHLFDLAHKSEILTVTCEYDIVPPNPISEAFHQRMGFVEVGQQNYGIHQKRVSLQYLNVLDALRTQ